MERKAVITITPDTPQHAMDVQTGEVTTLEMIEYLQALSKLFAQKIIAEYADITGDTDIKPEHFDKYVEFLRTNKLK